MVVRQTYEFVGRTSPLDKYTLFNACKEQIQVLHTSGGSARTGTVVGASESLDVVTSVENRKIVQREKRKSNIVYGMYVLITG